MRAAVIAALGMMLTGQMPIKTYRVSTEAVVVDVSVLEGDTPVTHLTADEFAVRDNGVLQRVIDLSREELPIDLTLVIDTSGSMEERDRRAIVAATAELKRSLNPVDHVTILAFGSHMVERPALWGMSDPFDVSAAGRGTALFDAMLLSFASPRAPGRRPFTIVMTDGADTSSYFDSGLVVKTATYASNPVVLVLIEDRSGPNRRTLETAVALTGGRVIRARAFGDLKAALLKALTSIRASYLLRYYPTGVDTGGWHEITVTVPETSYTIRARPGYFRPAA